MSSPKNLCITKLPPEMLRIIFELVFTFSRRKRSRTDVSFRAALYLAIAGTNKSMHNALLSMQDVRPIRVLNADTGTWPIRVFDADTRTWLDAEFPLMRFPRNLVVPLGIATLDCPRFLEIRADNIHIAEEVFGSCARCDGLLLPGKSATLCGYAECTEKFCRWCEAASLRLCPCGCGKNICDNHFHKCDVCRVQGVPVGACTGTLDKCNNSDMSTGVHYVCRSHSRSLCEVEGCTRTVCASDNHTSTVGPKEQLCWKHRIMCSDDDCFESGRLTVQCYTCEFFVCPTHANTKCFACGEVVCSSCAEDAQACSDHPGQVHCPSCVCVCIQCDDVMSCCLIACGNQAECSNAFCGTCADRHLLSIETEEEEYCDRCARVCPTCETVVLTSDHECPESDDDDDEGDEAKRAKV